MYMTLAHSRSSDLNKLRFSFHRINVFASGVTHALSQAAQHLMNGSFYPTLIRNSSLYTFGYQFVGLLIFQKPFGVIMSGIGVIALAGIVVNNNIVLIDTYNQLLKRGMDKRDAILRTGMQRLRPVLLTTVTTILGLLPMVLEMNIDLINQKVEFGAPSTQWWSQLATAVAGGLAFATVLTLVLTPCLLMLGRQHKVEENANIIVED